MSYLWLTDIHLDFISKRLRSQFFSRLANEDANAILIGGDISCAPRLVEDLDAIRRSTLRKIYFVLGNHDYYQSNFNAVREQVRKIARAEEKLFFLEDIGYAHLRDDLALVGHGSWGDGRAGNYYGSDLELADFFSIEDFRGRRKRGRLPLLNRLGDEAAGYLGRWCREAARRYPRVWVLTHAVPFYETCTHNGRVDPNGLPFFCCQRVGEELIQVAWEYPEVEFTIFSGHTHSAASQRILPNLVSHVSGAAYHQPDFVILSENE